MPGTLIGVKISDEDDDAADGPTRQVYCSCFATLPFCGNLPLIGQNQVDLGYGKIPLLCPIHLSASKDIQTESESAGNQSLNLTLLQRGANFSAIGVF
jgi:hypothetical protein